MIKQASCCTPSPIFHHVIWPVLPGECHVASHDSHVTISCESCDHIMWVMWQYHVCHVTPMWPCDCIVTDVHDRIVDHVVFISYDTYDCLSSLLLLSPVTQPEAETQWIQWLLQPLEENDVSSRWTRITPTITSQPSWESLNLVHNNIAIHLILAYKYI